MKEHLVNRPDQTSISGCIETYEVDPASAAAIPEKRCYTVEDLQVMLSCGRETVYNLIKHNEFRWFRVGTEGGGAYRISKKSFDEWLDNKL